MESRHSGMPPLGRLKQRAKQLKKEKGISQSEAYSQLSKEYGYSSWPAMRKALQVAEDSKQYIPSPSVKFVADEDVEMSEEDYDVLDNERSSDLPCDQKQLLTNNKRELTKLGVEFSIFEPTLTGLSKSILDATQPVRTHFEMEDFHFYSEQGQGIENRVQKQSFLITDDQVIRSKVSLYRPKTKKGDPRMWFSKLPMFCEAGDQIAIIVFNNSLYLVNLTKVSLSSSLAQPDSEVFKFFDKYLDSESTTADELLQKLKELAATALPALRQGDTGVGYTIETMLGIAANSNKKPDYKGIEIKSGRGGRNRSTLFAQVPDWNLSPCKKSAEILNKYGYERGEDLKLYCTLSTQKENSQGLSFIYDETKDELQEWYKKSELVAVWPGALLRKRLKEKHAETFWIHADSEVIDGVEHFILKSVTHTKGPILSQLLPLIQAGTITMDHLIKRSGKTNRVSEKGPLFKINKHDLNLLFPEPVLYNLSHTKEK